MNIFLQAYTSFIGNSGRTKNAGLMFCFAMWSCREDNVRYITKNLGGKDGFGVDSSNTTDPPPFALKGTKRTRDFAEMLSATGLFPSGSGGKGSPNSVRSTSLCSNSSDTEERRLFLNSKSYAALQQGKVAEAQASAATASMLQSAIGSAAFQEFSFAQQEALRQKYFDSLMGNGGGAN
jgi:hypothetical protein